MTEYLLSSGIGLSGVAADFAATSGWMHRALTHRAWEPRPELKGSARTVLWGLGVKPRVWAFVHRKHHAMSDVEGDPHSPVLQGRYGVLKLLWRNPFLYRKAAREVDDGELPATLRPDRWDRRIFDKTKIGLAASFAGHILLNKALGNPAMMGVVSFGIEKVGYIAGGNFVNSIGHAGRRPLRALLTGKIEAHPDGTYGADSVAIGLATVGEGMQKWHHDNPEDVFFGPADQLSWPRRIIRDSMGSLALWMIDQGWATKGSAPPSAETA